ncbi:hypothetical protein AMS68_007525 [Peltaster fructicola]|uniref:Uncharacterized protein n=1 Tax=Peltaster fructicola TaxID=286661 RepID=A0A6H0Y594_9PEZI|nr:hypothetical protein AMS68_007525 [Peltaster fructicola]
MHDDGSQAPEAIRVDSRALEVVDRKDLDALRDYYSKGPRVVYEDRWSRTPHGQAYFQGRAQPQYDSPFSPAETQATSTTAQQEKEPPSKKGKHLKFWLLGLLVFLVGMLAGAGVGVAIANALRDRSNTSTAAATTASGVAANAFAGSPSSTSSSAMSTTSSTTSSIASSTTPFSSPAPVTVFVIPTGPPSWLFQGIPQTHATSSASAQASQSSS